MKTKITIQTSDFYTTLKTSRNHIAIAAHMRSGAGSHGTNKYTRKTKHKGLSGE